MMLANAPSKVTGLNVLDLGGNQTDVSWNASPESDIDFYIVKYTDQMGNSHEQTVRGTETSLNRADISKPISVKAVNNRGIQGWDWTVWGK